MERTRKLKLNVSILGKDHLIAVNRDVVRVLGMPEYIRILQNEARHAVAVQACDEKELLSFKVPEKLFTTGYSSSFRIYSFSFVDKLVREYHLDNHVRYSFRGSYVEGHNAVVFPLRAEATPEGFPL